jgi:uncharacterized repeat protein (TIGR02543 family)
MLLLKKKNRAFTLVELLAIILILGIIALIVIPVIINTVNNARKSAFRDSVFGAFKAADYVFELSHKKDEQVDVKSLQLKNNRFTSGNFILDEKNNVIANFVDDERFCAYGPKEDLKVASSCASLDFTNPFVDEAKFNIQTTSNTIKVVLDDKVAYDDESGIDKYRIELYKNGNLVSYREVKEVGQIVFNNLSNDTIFIVKLIVKNGNERTSTIEKTVKTDIINAPTYVLEPSGYAKSKKVTINYYGDYINEYSIDGINFHSYTGPIIFNENGFIIARVTDGTNYILGSTLSINQIDNTDPEVNITANVASGTWTNNSVTMTANVNPVSTPSGYTYEWYNGATKVYTSQDNTYTVDTATILNNIYTVKVITGVGNSKTSGGYNIRIDKVIPTASYVTNGGNFVVTSGNSVNISTKVNTSDANSLIADRKYAWSQSNTVEPVGSYANLSDGVDISTTLNGPSKYLWVKVTDNAGNSYITVSNAFNTYYQIKYNLDGGTGNISDDSKKYGTSKQITSVIPTRNGYNFKGWGESSGGAVTYASGSAYSADAPVTLYAIWQVAEVEATDTITFDFTTTANRSSSKALTGFIRIVSVTVNNGSVSYSMNGNTITTNVSNGTPSYQTTCSNQYVCENVNACYTSCWSCSESYTGTCCGCPCGWQTSCCCRNEVSCGYKNVCSGNNYYSYVVTIRYMKGA